MNLGKFLFIFSLILGIFFVVIYSALNQELFAKNINLLAYLFNIGNNEQTILKPITFINTTNNKIEKTEMGNFIEETTSYFEEHRKVSIFDYREENKLVVTKEDKIEALATFSEENKQPEEIEKKGVANLENKLNTKDMNSVNVENETVDNVNFVNSFGNSQKIREGTCDDYENKNYPKIIINEIQFENESIQDEFIELYNPNNEEVDLNCWILEKYSSGGSLTILIPASKFKGKIKSYSFFLITSSSTKEKYQSDLIYAQSYSISKNNVIVLKKPNGKISDLVGYGDNQEKIYQYEGEPFIAQNFKNKSIQRKNFFDNDNNFKDFWLRNPSPQNSSITQLSRNDFVDLTNFSFEEFIATTTIENDEVYLKLSFKEPSFNVNLGNYSFALIFSTSTNFENNFSHQDFGINDNLPQQKFDGSMRELIFKINKCPLEENKYYLVFYLKDKFDEENKNKESVALVEFPKILCDPDIDYGFQNQDNNSIASENNIISTENQFSLDSSSKSNNLNVKILFSEIRIAIGTSTGEYLEFYNPNGFDVDLKDWEIKKINSQGNEEYFLGKRHFDGIIIKSYSYLLLLNENSIDFSNYPSPDVIYPKSYDLAKNNCLVLYNLDNILIDKACWKDVDNEKSYQRKKTMDSTPETINNEPYGNAYDTDDDSDFIWALFNPENSSLSRSPFEP